MHDHVSAVEEQRRRKQSAHPSSWPQPATRAELPELCGTWGKGRAGVGCPVSIIEIHLILELRHHFAPQSSAVSLSFYSFFIFHPAALQISRVAVKEISSKICLSVPSTL